MKLLEIDLSDDALADKLVKYADRIEELEAQLAAIQGSPSEAMIEQVLATLQRRRADTIEGVVEITVAELDAVITALRGSAALPSEAMEPFANYHGDLPDYDDPLRPVYESGIQYAVELLAKTLGVDDYDICDGTEEFDGDLSGTLLNIVVKTWPTDASGDWLDLRDAGTRAAMRAATPTAPVQDDDAELVRLLRLFADAYSSTRGMPWIGTVRPEQAFTRAADRIERLSPTPDTGLIEALEKCRDKFREYVRLHEAKLHDGTPSAEYVSILRKVERNRAMVKLCEDALANAAPAQVESGK